MTDHAPIDDQFREHRKDWEGTPTPRLWEQLEDRLDAYAAPDVKRKKKIFRLGIAATLLAVIGLSFALFMNQNTETGHLAVLSETEAPVIETAHPPIADESPIDKSIVQRIEEAQSLPTTPALTQTPATDGTATRSTTGQQAGAGIASTSPAERMAPPERRGETEAAVPEMLPGTASFDVQNNAREEAANDEEFASAPTAKQLAKLEEVQEIHTAKAEKVSRERDMSKKAVSEASFATDGHYNEREAVAAYRASGDRTEAFATPSLTILLPENGRKACTYRALLIEEDSYYTDACQNDAMDLARDQSTILSAGSLLHNLLFDGAERVRQIAAEMLIRKCDGGEELVFIYRLGTDLSALEERVTWPADADCLPPDGAEILREITSILTGRK